MRLLTVPYDSGHKALRMGAGPFRIARELGASYTSIETANSFTTEIATSFFLYRRLAEAVGGAVASGEKPVVLGGNCGVTVGVSAGLGVEDLALLWFDAHGEFMTPDTTTSGFLDGMALSILTGRCFRKLAASVPGFGALSAQLATLVGSRDFSEGERDELLAAGVGVLGPREGEIDDHALAERLDVMRSAASRLYVHVDLDVLDPRFGRANQYAAENGLSPESIVRVIETAAARFDLVALSVASYDPSTDESGAVAVIGAEIVRRFC